MTSPNKQTVAKYIDGFNKTDHAQILSCLTDDIEWTVFGFFQLAGKEAYDNAIEGEGFVGHPKVVLTRMVEEDDVVMAEGTVEATRVGGEIMRLAIAEVFVMQNCLIKERRAFMVALKENSFR